MRIADKPLNVLVACEESQAVTIELRKLGHIAYSCDLQPCSGGRPELHIQGDALKAISSFSWDMILAFPPCTYLSAAGNRWLFEGKKLNLERYEKGLLAKEFFLKLLNADCPRIALENPISTGIYDMPLHSQEIEPYMFGDPFIKATRLWLRGLPPLMATDIVVPDRHWMPNSHKKEAGLASRCPKARSKTFSGIAKAMAAQWGGRLIDV